ncbi:hypothetical protein QA648_27460 (plasmid) [Rhizobium sp. CB3171]|uniref:hypothetical protein n=1 Tax=Rhizobium sp. CB3171 TaxID=3039157 RepID=UPI0024B10766|nr:hypothetical protein [Rhizobium sp. CB3171]WFU04522.1 hypothetical protein QA648_27460 [Rhizobium sp. CB3171]
MPKDSLQIGPDLATELLYLAKWPNLGFLQYFQSIRSGAICEDAGIAQNYHAMKLKFVAQLEWLVREEGSFDAIVMPPSSRGGKIVG